MEILTVPYIIYLIWYTVRKKSKDKKIDQKRKDHYKEMGLYDENN